MLDERALLERRVDDRLGRNRLTAALALAAQRKKEQVSRESPGLKDKQVATHSDVMTTLHSQSMHRSRSDSAEKPAKTTEWTAPIRAQARKAAAACQVIGR